MTIFQGNGRRPALFLGLAIMGGVPAQPALEEIVVSARQREMPIREAPIAISTLSGSDFDMANIVRLDNFNGYVPGLVVAKNDGAGRVVAMRGIGWETAQNLTTQPSVLTYIDGVYLANPLVMGLDLGEVERVEARRGPQGTEFGQGTTGGAINIITRKPDTEKVGGSVEISYGSYDHVRARAALNVPLTEGWAFRAALQKYRRDGFAEIEGGELDGYQLDNADSLTGRLAVLWRPADNFTALAQAWIYDSDQHAAAQKNINDPNPDPRRLTQDYPGIFALENYSASMVMEWQVTSRLSLKSTTGWQALRKQQSVDGDRLNEELVAVNILGFSTSNWDALPYWDNDSDAVSQEINLNYRGGRLDWVTGAYYLNHVNFNDFLEASGAAPFSSSPASLPRAQLNAATLPPFQSDLNFTEYRTVTREDYAWYGQATGHLNEVFSLTLGARYQHEDQLDEGGAFFSEREPRTTSASKLTWKAGLDLRLRPDLLIYGLVSTGWKNGGSSSGGVFLPTRFKPEEVMAFELGSRSSFLDERARLAVTAYYYDHRHFQFTYEDPEPYSSGTWTIPRLEEYGIESELSWLLAPGWQLDAMLAWQDGKVKSDFYALDVEDFRAALRPFQLGLFTPGALEERIRLNNSNNLKGNTPPKLVDLSARLALTHNRDLVGGARLSARAEFIYRGNFQARVFNHPTVDQTPAYEVVNLHFRYEPARMPLSLSLGVTNLFDKDGINNVFTNPYGLWTTSNEYIPPREIIGTATYSW